MQSRPPSDGDLAGVAERLVAARRAGARIVLGPAGPRDDTEGFAIQDMVVSALASPVIGWKVRAMPDGAVNFADINPFVQALTDSAGYAATYPNCDIQLADVNDDGAVDFGDINPFVALLSH